MYTDFYIHSCKDESSFDDVITSIASGITTHEQAEKVSQMLKFNFIIYIIYNKIEWKLWGALKKLRAI
jgi:hypothetical protein